MAGHPYENWLVDSLSVDLTKERIAGVGENLKIVVATFLVLKQSSTAGRPFSSGNLLFCSFPKLKLGDGTAFFTVFASSAVGFGESTAVAQSNDVRLLRA